MYFVLDSYDWTHSPIWRRFLWQVILWPLLVPIFPDSVLATRSFLSDEEASFRRELDKFRKSPPPCGHLFRFRPKQTLHGPGCDEIDPPCCGEFVMASADLELAYRQGKKNNRPGSFFCGELQDIFTDWLKHRDELLRETSELPSLFADVGRRFSVDALKEATTELATAGHARIRCAKCAADFSGSQIIRKEEYVSEGSYQCDRLYCPQNHLLLSRSGYTGIIRRRKS